MRILASTFLVLFLLCTSAFKRGPEQSIISVKKAETSTALTQAIIDDDAEQVRLILNHDFDLSEPVDMELVEIKLLNKRKDQAESFVELIKIPSFFDSTTPLMLAAGLHKNSDITLILLEAGADPNSTDEVGRTALILNAVDNGSTSVASALIEHGADVNAIMRNGLAPLYGACLNGQSVEFIQLLLENGSDPNASLTNHGSTPLMEAAQNYPDLQVINLLLEYGANIHAENFKGHTPFFLACAFNNSVEVVDRLYITGGGANHQLNDLGLRRTPLMSASLDGDPELVQYLISIGANVNQTDDKGDTSLSLAAKWNSPTVAMLLINAGAKIEERDSEGATPLLLACKYNSIHMVRTLLNEGAEPRATDYDGFGFRDYTRVYKNENETEGILGILEDKINSIP